ncbi:hypothetical protein ABC304_02155 [Microbacterium sp. 1P10UB]|uniref:hypothetical protein n=1 Tax=unclassified Microbacterium TaxID=2609290 RepID=UPI0039A27AF9
MNNTNRALNRIVLLILGVVLLVIGGGLATAAAVPAAGQAWDMTGQGLQQWTTQLWESSKIAGGQLTWLAVGVLAALLLLVIIAIVVISKGVRGRSRTTLRATGSANSLGRITVTEGFASDALKNALGGYDEILSAKVTANDVAHEPVLHVSVTPRQNTSPLHVAETVDRLVTNLGTLTGQQLTTFISVHSGLRAKLAHDQRRLS